jgi:hypothetical protein
MKIVILCGGKGTRLREETEFRPKPMVPIGGRPILWHIMKTYACHGHKDFVLCLGYKGDTIKEYFRNYLWNVCDVTLMLGRQQAIQFHDRHGEEDWNVTVADTGEESMTAYRVKKSQRYIRRAKTFCSLTGTACPPSISTRASPPTGRPERRAPFPPSIRPAVSELFALKRTETGGGAGTQKEGCWSARRHIVKTRSCGMSRRFWERWVFEVWRESN